MAVRRMTGMKGADMCGSPFRQAMEVKLMVKAWIVLVGFICVISTISLSARASTNIPTTATFVYVADFSSGRILMEKQKDAPMKPASMAKIMTSYIVFERISWNAIHLMIHLTVTLRCWRS